MRLALYLSHSLPVSASQVLTLQISVTMAWMNNHLVILPFEVSNMSISGLYLHLRLYNKIVQEFGERVYGTCIR